MIRFPRTLRIAAVPAAVVLSISLASTVAAAEPTTAPSSGPTVALAGTGTVAAHGAGTAAIAGNGTVTGTMDGGWIRVRTHGSATTVVVTGWHTRVRFVDGTVLYRDVHGSFSATGPAVGLTLQGPEVSFTATGSGTVVLRGTGTYQVNGGAPIPWPHATRTVAY